MSTHGSADYASPLALLGACRYCGSQTERTYRLAYVREDRLQEFVTPLCGSGCLGDYVGNLLAGGLMVAVRP